MDPKLEAVFRTALYTTEKIDTRMGIRHQDPEQKKRKSHDSKEDAEGEFGDDHTTLSVSALHGFLNSLLQQAGQGSAQPAEPDLPAPAHNPAGPVAPHQQSGHAAAANAYQSTAQSGSTMAITLNDPPPPAATGAATIDLSAEELRAIDRLLRDVETLAARGVATINLHPADRFLDSLSLGVAEALGAE